MKPSRRELMVGAAIATTGVAASPSRLARLESDSGLVTGKPVALPYTEIEGFLSKEQLNWHHESHYGGALKKFATLDATWINEHKQRVSKANSVMLHELYFANMTPKKTSPGAATRKALNSRFADLECWLDDFRAVALSSRGWAMLAWHPFNGQLYNVSADAHDDGLLCGGIPLAVIDMYEHSYYLDFQNRKADYVDGFMEHLNWDELERRMRAE